MRFMACLRMLMAVCCLWAAAGLCAAQQRPIRIDTRCHDPSIQFQLGQYVVSEIDQSQTHRLVSDGSAPVHVRLLAAPVRQEGSNTPLGVGLATLVTRRKASGRLEVVKFSNSFVPLADLESAVRTIVRESIGQN